MADPQTTWPRRDTRLVLEYADVVPGLKAEIERLKEALAAINRRADPGKDRTFDDCSADLYWCACEARRVLHA